MNRLTADRCPRSLVCGVLPKYEITLARDTGVPMQFTLKCAWISVALTLGSIAGYSAERDAFAILATIRARHLPFGTVLDPVFASADSDQIASYRRCGDSAIWTGHYLAAEAFRYKVTRAADALDNVKKAIVGIKTLQRTYWPVAQCR